jgi:CheY-like chemotaxis protein
MYSNSILLVQSPTDSTSHLRTRLEDKGYTVVEAPDSTAAMAIVNRSEIGLVVTELYVQVGGARCLARLIAKSPAFRRTKLLAYTAHGKRQDRDWARRIGADGYVITRSGEERFLSVVDHLMQTPATPRRATTHRPPRAS